MKTAVMLSLCLAVGATAHAAKRAILACDLLPEFTAECAATKSKLVQRGWAVRQIGEVASDMFPPGGVAESSSAAGSLAGGAWSEKYEFSVSTGSTLTASITGTGDADLYVWRDGTPPTSPWYCRPYLSTSNETCNVPGGARVTVMVKGYSPSSTFNLQVSYTRPTTTLADLVHADIAANVHNGDQVLFYVWAHGNNDGMPYESLFTPNATFPFNDSGAYAGPINSSTWPSMMNWHINSSAATWVWAWLTSWDMRSFVQEILAKGAKVTLDMRACHGGALIEMLDKEFGHTGSVCAIATTSSLVTAIGTHPASAFLTQVLANPNQTWTMDSLRKWLASQFEGVQHSAATRMESSGYSNGCSSTMNLRTMVTSLYNSLGKPNETFWQGGPHGAQPSYVLGRPYRFNSPAAAVPSHPLSNPNSAPEFIFIWQSLSWLSETYSRLYGELAGMSWLSQAQKDAVINLPVDYLYTAARAQNAWEALDTLLQNQQARLPTNYSGANPALFSQLAGLAAGRTVDHFIRQMMETQCLCGTSYSPQSALDCGAVYSAAAEATFTCSNPLLWIDQVVRFYPAIWAKLYEARQERALLQTQILQVSAALTPIEQGCSASACTLQTF
jgi:hypothetical protein